MKSNHRCLYQASVLLASGVILLSIAGVSCGQDEALHPIPQSDTTPSPLLNSEAYPAELSFAPPVTDQMLLPPNPVSDPSLTTGMVLDGVICPECHSAVCQCEVCDCGLYSICGPTTNPPWWGRAELLGWNIHGDRLPSLITSSPAGTDPALAGRLGEPTTTVLFGGDRVDSGLRAGGRFTGGVWFNENRLWGGELSFFGLDGPNSDFTVSSNGDPILARPFFNTDPGIDRQDTQLLALPGLASGSFRVDNDGQIYSAALAIRRNTRCRTVTRLQREIQQRVDIVSGFRYLRYAEDLDMFEVLQPTGMFFAPGTLYELTDRITTENDFYGAEFGMDFFRQRRRLLFEMSWRLALGNMRRRVYANGDTTLTVPGSNVPMTIPGGFYIAADGLQGSDDEFSVIPQARIALGFFMRHNLQFNIGYDFMFINNVVRPSTAINPRFPGSRLVSGVGGDTLTFVSTDLWLQGLSGGLTWNF